MIVYISMFILSMLAGSNTRHRSAHFSVAVVGFIFVVIIGMRFHVGADWETYQAAYDRTEIHEIGEWHRVSTDFGYSMINYLCRELDLGVGGVNTICAMLLMLGIGVFAAHQPKPWLVFCAATPYLIIVVGMGYTRQSVAVGLELLALVYLSQNRVFWFLAIIGVAAMFHRSVIVIAPLAITFADKRQIWHWGIFVIGASIGGYYLFLDEVVGTYWQNYVESTRYDSAGALVRTAMSVAAAVVFWIGRNHLELSGKEKRLWGAFGVMSLSLLVILTFSTTAADRMGLYVIPLQLFLCGRIGKLGREFESMAVLAYAATMAVWLGFATHAYAWLPYQFLPFTTELEAIQNSE